MIKKHREILAKMMTTFGLDAYQVAWIAFIKGVIVGYLLHLIF